MGHAGMLRGHVEMHPSRLDWNPCRAQVSSQQGSRCLSSLVILDSGGSQVH